MQYKAIISDIDGTITKNSIDAFPNERILTSIKHAEEKGIFFTLATGRPLPLLKNLLEYMNNKVLVIFDNGAGIYDSKNKKVIWESLITGKTINQLIPIITQFPNKGISLSSNSDKQILNPSTVTDTILVRKCTVLGMEEKSADAMISLLEEKYKDLSVGKASSWSGNDVVDVYITNPDATKQHAVLKLAEILNISTHEIIGIGDHYNDFPLLMACGLKVAMGNAVDELKTIADYVAPSVDEDGVADVIERFVLNS